MNKAVSNLKRFARDEDGAALIEYTVLIGLMLVGVVATVSLVGTWVGGRWTALNSAL
ncbi:MAG: Flp family type IVb pilin [Hyphomicrobiales bacterium]|nr:Flp family type IVb pilin [Hyphomicrobiales bacterium]